MARKVIPFFLDQNVPVSVGRVLVAAGHDVTRLSDAMEEETPDKVIEVACSSYGHVLVTGDRDFKAISRRLDITKRQYRETLHRVLIRCDEPVAAKRVKNGLSLIESEWELSRPQKPMIIEVHDKTFRTWR